MALRLGAISAVIFLVVFSCFTAISEATPTFKKHLITSLPGAPNAVYNQYSGYIHLSDDLNGKALFFWLVESVIAPETKPLTLWLNGGPGCSSVGVGALAELGPFFTNKAANGLNLNLHAWNKESNILFLEQPVGTGYSYSNTSSDYVMGDKQAAIDVHHFLMRWLNVFSHYIGRDFYVTGESYGGHYIPHIAKQLWENMDVSEPHIPFKGFAIGNPWTDPAVDYRGEVDFWYSRALISTETYTKLTENCGVVDYWEDIPGSICLDYLTRAYTEMGDVNIYDVYVDVCHPNSVTPSVKALLDIKYKNLHQRLSARSPSPVTPSPVTPSPVTTSLPWEYDPCAHWQVEVYLNKKEVQRALHANTTGLPWEWTECSTVLQYSDSDSLASVLPLYHELLQTPLQILIFSGDVDSAIPTMGTRRWILQLEGEGHLRKSKAWEAWYLEEQVGGYSEEYNNGNFRFVTIRNAGHMVPYMQPARALQMYKAFLANTSMPTQHAPINARRNNDNGGGEEGEEEEEEEEEEKVETVLLAM